MDALEYLFSLEKIGIKFGLENIAALCESLGRPQDAFHSVIVAGTNGKGSVTAMVEHAARAAGLRTARYTSPHLVNLEERFVVLGQPIDRRTLSDAAALVRDHAERLMASGRLHASPTFFEVTTAIAFEVFRSAGVEVAVLEVGLGGRFDATNIVSPIAAAVTSIDLDHETYLGGSLAAIAREKAGVIKPGIPVVVGRLAAEADAVIRDVCHEHQARYIGAESGIRINTRFLDGRATFDLETPDARYRQIRLALRGRHQVGNALVAVRLLETLRTCGLEIPGDSIRSALEQVEWRGRLDLVRVAPERRVLLDAAHNPAGAAVLAEYLREVHPAGLPLVFAAMRDKDAAGMLRLLAPRATRLIITAPRTARAADPESLVLVASQAGVECPVEVATPPEQALERGWITSPLVCAAGSIVLIGDLLASLDAARRDVRV